MATRRLIFTMLYLMTALLPVMSQSEPLKVQQRTFGIRDGLAANSISGMAQDSNGLMWIATWNGLCCYDGYRFTTFPGNRWGDDDALTTNRIAKVDTDRENNVWLRTYDGEVFLYDTRQCRYFNISQAVDRKYDVAMKPRNIYCLPNGYIWITDDAGVTTLRIDSRRPTDVDRMEVFGTKGYAYPDKVIHKVECDAAQHELVTTERRTLCYMGNGRFKTLAAKDIRQQKDTTDSALNWRLAACGVSKQVVDKWHIDQQGNLWYSTDAGLTLATFQKQRIRRIPVVDGQQVRSVLCRHDGTVWAGTQDGYLRVGNAWLSPDGRLSTSKVRFSDRIYALFEDSRNRVWIGTKGQGLFLLQDSQPIVHYTHNSHDPYSLSNDYVYDVDEDPKGNIWIATYGGGVNIVKREVLEPKTGKLQFLHGGNQLKEYPLTEHSRVRRITHSKEGAMYISTTTGLLTTAPLATLKNHKFHVTLHEQEDTTSLLTNDVMQVLVTSMGAVYVVTQGGGVQKLDSEKLVGDKLKMHDVNVLNRGVGNVLSMAEDLDGNIWIVREVSIERYNPKTGVLLQYGPNSIDEGTRLTEALPALCSKGNVLLGAVGGMLTFNIADMQNSEFVPRIVFTNVQYQGEQNIEPLLYRKTLVVTPDRRSLTISFAALDFNDNYLLQYAYRLTGSQKWNYVREPRVAFSQMQPGVYQLEVRSTNSDGVWTDNTTILTLDVRPIWYERRWVQLLFLLAFVGFCTWAVIAWLRHRQQTREREQRLANILRQYSELQEQLDNLKAEGNIASYPEPASREYKLAEVVIVDEDELVMDRLMKFLEQRIDDDSLRIDDMAEAVNMGRTVFYEKIRQLVGVSPSDFLRQVRMQRARQLIAKSNMNISQVAYAVGFTDPKYFAKCFK